MVDVAEHVYDDDPRHGHPDVRTQLDGVSYYLLGNGLIQAAVQHAPGGSGTPLGLLLMNPDRLGKKRESLTMHPVFGLEPTVVRVATNGLEIAPQAATLLVAWAPDAPVPTVQATWGEQGLAIHERFYCPSATTARVAREVSVLNFGREAKRCAIRTGTDQAALGHEVSIPAGGRTSTWFAYDLDPSGALIAVRLVDDDPIAGSAAAFWADRTAIAFGEPALDHLFRTCRMQLPAAVSSRGRVDGSLWQYNREWVRDQAFLAQALTALGHREIASTMLRRLLRDFVTVEGATLDSSEVRARDDVELDQNGVLLYVLHEYVNWTGDLDLVANAWDRITALAEYPLREEFRHQPSGLLSGSREFWERHAAHGIEPGLETAYQFFVSLGLSSAAGLAGRLNRLQQAARWQEEADALRTAILSHPQYKLLDRRGFIKRRTLDGRIQEAIVARPDAGLPAGVPLAARRTHLLNPDTCTVLPIVFGFVDAGSEVARATLEHVEGLWNQEWGGGGYGRYDVSSEPDSPGAWPFASLFVARAYAEAGDSERVWRVLRWLDGAPGANAGTWFEFYGPRVAPPFPQVGLIPWTWAELTLLFVCHLLGVRPGVDEVRVRPRLPAGLERVEARLPIRDGWLRLELWADDGAPAGREFVVPCRSGDMVLSAPVRTLS